MFVVLLDNITITLMTNRSTWSWWKVDQLHANGLLIEFITGIWLICQIPVVSTGTPMLVAWDFVGTTSLVQVHSAEKWPRSAWKNFEQNSWHPDYIFHNLKFVIGNRKFGKENDPCTSRRSCHWHSYTWEKMVHGSIGPPIISEEPTCWSEHLSEKKRPQVGSGLNIMGQISGSG